MPNAGLLPAAVLAQRIDLSGLIDGRLQLAKDGANSGAKALSVIGSMLAGGDSIDDVAVLRAGAAASLFDVIRAPSTIGSWLRAHPPPTVFASDKRRARQVRLVVRRVAPTPGSQLALFTTWDYHAFVTDRDLPLAQVEADHRRHAVVEQSIAVLKSAGLAHLPSGEFQANAAWLALAVMAHNLGRAVGHLAGPELDKATALTLRRKVFTMPGRLVHSGRRRHLQLPASWPWVDPSNKP